MATRQSSGASKGGEAGGLRLVDTEEATLTTGDMARLADSTLRTVRRFTAGESSVERRFERSFSV